MWTESQSHQDHQNGFGQSGVDSALSDFSLYPDRFSSETKPKTTCWRNDRSIEQHKAKASMNARYSSSPSAVSGIFDFMKSYNIGFSSNNQS